MLLNAKKSERMNCLVCCSVAVILTGEKIEILNMAIEKSKRSVSLRRVARDTGSSVFRKESKALDRPSWYHLSVTYPQKVLQLQSLPKLSAIESFLLVLELEAMSDGVWSVSPVPGFARRIGMGVVVPLPSALALRTFSHA